MDRIEPGYAPHKRLEEDVVLYLECMGYYTFEATYHTVLDPEIKDLLSRTFNPTALYIRGRADRVALHWNQEPTFEWEAKTHQSSKYHDMTIEALPLAHHIIKNKLGVRCLYAYGSPFDNTNYGFWVDDLPPVKLVMIPNTRWTSAGVEFYNKVFESVFKDSKIINMDKTKGSNDPFVIIDEGAKKKLKDWRILIDEISHDTP